MRVQIGFDASAVGGDYFVLDDPVKGVLDNDTYLLAPDTAYVDVTDTVRAVQVKRGRSRVLSHFVAAQGQIILLNADRRYEPTYKPTIAERTNLVTNPSFDAGLGGFGGSSVTAHDATFSLFGAGCAKITMSSLVDSNIGAWGAGLVTVPAAGTYILSARFYVGSGSPLAGRTVTLSFEGGTTANYSVGASSPATLVAGQWVTATRVVTVTSVAGTSPALVSRLSGSLATAVGENIWTDAWCYESGSTAGPYFDGSVADGSIRVVEKAWTGTAHASTSTLSYYVSGTGSPYYGAIRPRIPIVIDEGGEVIATALIEDWNFGYQPGKYATATAILTDAFVLLAAPKVPAATQTAELTGARIATVLDAIGWPEASRELDTGAASCGADVTDGTESALNYLQKVADNTEPGALFINKDGLVSFRDRNALQNVLASAPSVSRLNLVPNPSFEVDTTGWTDMGGLTRITTDYARGVACAQFAYSGGGTAGAQYTDIPVIAGTTYTLSAYMKHSAAVAATTVMNIVWLNAGGTVLDDTHLSLAASTSWTRVSQTRTAPATATKATIRFYRTPGESGGATPVNVWLDAVLFEAASSAQPYFDGGLSDANGSVVQAWTGTEHASTSTQEIYTPVRFGPTGIPFAEITPAFGTDEMTNKVKVTYVGGEVEISDQTSIDRNGEVTSVTGELATVLADGAAATELGEWVVGRYKDATYRIDQIAVHLHALTSQQKVTVLGLELGDVVIVNWTPSGVGTALEQYVVIDGIEHDAAPNNRRHKVTFTLSEAISAFILDSSEFGVLDDDVLGF